MFEPLETRRLLSGNPLVITQGGTYGGRWVSTDPKIPAVLIDTTEPVIIQNSAIAATERR